MNNLGDRRRFLTSALSVVTGSLLFLAGGARSVFASLDPRPEFASSKVEQVLLFYFGTSDAADDASIRITAPLVTENREVVPFKIHAPGAEKIAVMTDANPEPLIIAMDRVMDKSGVIIGRAQLRRTGYLMCYVMRNDILTRASARINVAGHWQEPFL